MKNMKLIKKIYMEVYIQNRFKVFKITNYINDRL